VNNTSSPKANADASASSSSEASSTQSQGQEQGQGQSQQSTSGANNEGNAQNVNISNARNAPAAFSGGANTTAECYTSIGGGASASIGGISFGFGKKAKDCAKLVLANDLYARGQKTAGDRIFCTITEVKETLGDDCLALINEVSVEHGRKEVLVPSSAVTDIVKMAETK
jgi:hypothetical protein